MNQDLSEKKMKDFHTPGHMKITFSCMERKHGVDALELSKVYTIMSIPGKKVRTQ